MSAAAAALQSAACRALQRRHADSFRCALFAKEQRFPIQSTTIRRFYSSDCFAKAKTSTVSSIIRVVSSFKQALIFLSCISKFRRKKSVFPRGIRTCIFWKQSEKSRDMK
jgi:hypothetical protein